MSNKKAKQARQARKMAGNANDKINPAQNWESKPWREYSEQQRVELAQAGIKTEADYLRIIRDGVRSEDTNDIYWWLISYGVGFYRSESEFVQAIAWRLCGIERDPERKALTGGDRTADLSHMRMAYAWNLKQGDKYFASPYSFSTPEGRAWLIGFLREYGITTLVVDTVDTGVFDIKDAIIIDLERAA